MTLLKQYENRHSIQKHDDILEDQFKIRWLKVCNLHGL